MRLEELKKGMLVAGLSPDGEVTLRDAEMNGDTAEILFRDASGGLGERLLLRSGEASVSVMREDGGWRFDGDGGGRLAAEAGRISSAYLFDPLLAIHISLVDSYPDQISAVYERMLGKQPVFRGLPGGFLGASEPPSPSILANRLTEEGLTPKRLAASAFGAPRLRASPIFRLRSSE